MEARRSKVVSAILLVDIEALVLEAKVHSAKVMNRDGIEPLLPKRTEGEFTRLKHLWLAADTRTKEKSG